MTKQVRTIARFAIIAALVAVSYSIDAAISMAGLPVRIAVVTLIVVLTVAQQFDFKTSLFTTGCFGLTSFLFAWFAPNITSEAFRNPLVSIFPRMCIGITMYFTFKGLKSALDLKKTVFMREILPRIVAGGVGVITNTVVVITMMGIFAGENVLYKVINVIIGVNFLIEILSGLLIVPPLSFAVNKPIKRLQI